MVNVFRKLKRNGRRRRIFAHGYSKDEDSCRSTMSGSVSDSASGPTSSCGTTENDSIGSYAVVMGNSDEENNATNRGGNTRTTATTTNEDVLAMVIYEKSQPITPPPPLPDSFKVWIENADALLKSREMAALLHSSRTVVSSAVVTSKGIVVCTGGLVVQAACLPVTLPLHVISKTTNLVVGVAGNVIQAATGSSSNGGESTSSQTPINGLVQNIMNAVPFFMSTANRVTNDVRGSAFQIFAPIMGSDNSSSNNSNSNSNSSESTKEKNPKHVYVTSSGESSAEQENFLDRLRLDIHVPKSKDCEETSTSTPLPKRSDISKYLLRVDDVQVLVTPDPASPESEMKALYIDLETNFSDEAITTVALSQLITRGLDVAATNTAAHFGVPDVLNHTSAEIDWKAEGSTNKRLKQMTDASVEEYYQKLHTNILVWSGKYRHSGFHGAECPLFLARGVLQMSPKDFLNLLWDSSRTHEYNKHSLGRKDVCVLSDDIANGGSNGTKVIKSETKVPFTGLSVSMCALMHASALDDNPDKGFIIVSRSLNSGMAGFHWGPSTHVESSDRNEILLGVNIMRPVPGRPDQTDLISVSQVSSTMVPKFLAFRIGMMGVEEFFKNMRTNSK